MAFNLRAYLAQPTTINGLSSLAATITGIAAHLFLHDITLDAAIAGVTLGAVRVLMPDNSNAQTAVEKLVKDAIEAEVQRRMKSALPLLFADGVAVANALQPAPAPVAPAAPVVPAA